MSPQGMPGAMPQMDQQSITKQMAAERARAVARRDILATRIQFMQLQVTSRRELVDRVVAEMPVNSVEQFDVLRTCTKPTKCMVQFALSYAEVASADADLYELTLNEMKEESCMLSEHVATLDEQIKIFSSGIIVAPAGAINPRKK